MTAKLKIVNQALHYLIQKLGMYWWHELNSLLKGGHSYYKRKNIVWLFL